METHLHATRVFFDEAFRASPTMVIIRGLSPEETCNRARKAWGMGIPLIEVPVSTPAGWDAFKALRKLEPTKPVGVGSVIHESQVSMAADLGATFCVSPGFDGDIATACVASKIFHLPGVASATDISAAVKLGYSWLKAFPAHELGSTWITSMLAPFPDVKFVCTGGMTLESWPNYQEAGARAVALGSRFA